MNRKLSAAVVAASLFAAGAASATGAQEPGGDQCKGAEHCVRFATLAPSQSPWGKVFNAWKHDAEKKTDGKLKVIWHWNGTQGPEPSVVGKIRSGQLWGAAITAVGLATVYAPINALQMPGAYESWAQLDEARDLQKEEFNKKLQEQGFYVSGWGDVGIARTMSKGFAVKTPEDLSGKSPGFLEGDKIAPKIFETMNLGLKGKPPITPKQTQVMEILANLNSGAINVLTTPALAAEQLQWTSRMTHLNTHIVSFGVGAMVISEKQLQTLPQDMRETMQNLGKLASDALAKKIRAEDEAAYQRALKKMEVYNPTPAEKEMFNKKYKESCNGVAVGLEAKKVKDSILRKLKARACKDVD